MARYAYHVADTVELNVLGHLYEAPFTGDYHIDNTDNCSKMISC